MRSKINLTLTRKDINKNKTKKITNSEGKILFKF
jgi:hypothetical protein